MNVGTAIFADAKVGDIDAERRIENKIPQIANLPNFTFEIVPCAPKVAAVRRA